MGDLSLIYKSRLCQKTENENERDRGTGGNKASTFILSVWVPSRPAFLKSVVDDKAEAGSLWDTCVWQTETFWAFEWFCVCAVERVVQVLVCSIMWVCARVQEERGGLLWNWVVNSLCMSADYSATGLGESTAVFTQLRTTHHKIAIVPSHSKFPVTKPHVVRETSLMVST